jgi:hypothetical protein
VVTLEDLDQVHGGLILEYRARARQPVVLDEDRYEHWRNPAHDRYFFRRLMWASLLSGGHATYGGLRTYEPYDDTGLRGVRGYFDANRDGLLEQGAHDFRHIHTFFREAGLTLAGMQPADDLVGGNPYLWKCAMDEGTYIIYMANPSGNDPASDVPGADAPTVSITLPDGSYSVRWFDPRDGRWTEGDSVTGGRHTFSPPETSPNRAEDRVLLIQADG